MVDDESRMRLFWDDFADFLAIFAPIYLLGSLRLAATLNSSRASLAGPLDIISPEFTLKSKGFSPLLAKAYSGV